MAADKSNQQSANANGSAAAAQDGGTAAGAGGVAVGRDWYGDYVAQSGEGSQSFDTMICQGSSIADLDMEVMGDFLRSDSVQTEDSFRTGAPFDEQLRNLCLLDNTVPTNAAILCFGSNPKRRIPGALCRCWHWEGRDRMTSSGDRRSFGKGLLSQFTSTIGFLRGCLRLQRIINRDGREDRPEIPFAALEEAVANALMHRDYRDKASVQVEVYADRVEVTSPGGLPPSMNEEMLGKSIISHPRNPLVTRSFQLAGRVEAAGSGICRMQCLMEDSGLPLPQFHITNETFRVVLFRPEDFHEEVWSEETLAQETHLYLGYLSDKNQYLDFKGMGVSDRVPLRIELKDLYVPLKACIALPRGETWERAMVGGRKLPQQDRDNLPDRLSESRLVLDLAKQHAGLIILGDPGSGKTTFLKRVALELATDSGSAPRLPLLLPLSAYANALQAQSNLRLDHFISRHFLSVGLGPAFSEIVNQAMKQGRATIMLDGLDEVRNGPLREMVAERVVDFFRLHRRAGNRLVVTSRIIGYHEVRPIAEGLQECTLVDFDDEQINVFVESWTSAVEKAVRGVTTISVREAKQEREELLRAIQLNPGVRQLAANPLLLTILALMKRQGMQLPDRRAELYDKYVEVLLSSWNRARRLDRTEMREIYEVDVDATRKTLGQLASWMHKVSPGMGLVEEPKLKDRLRAFYDDRPEKERDETVSHFLRDVREHAGLLLERGPGRYGFIHLTFEEYLTALDLGEMGQMGIEPVVAELTAHIEDPAWREVALLTVGYIGIVQRRDRAASALVEGLLKCDAGKGGQTVVLAGDAVADAWPGGVTKECKEETVAMLLATISDDVNVEPRVRVEAGNTLARLGDPRFREDAWFLPHEEFLGFVEIAGGPFLMGSDKRKGKSARDDETPQHEVHLPTFHIGKYPVTVAQFRAFVEDSGTQPKDEDYLRGVANHPVVNVTWHEACAYCEWLTQRLRECKVMMNPLVEPLCHGWRVVLPSEAEWEKAARGRDGRIYPWGNDTDASRANWMNNIGSTSPVGCFPGGKSPYHVIDMSGNACEWTRSLWGKEWEMQFPYPYTPADSARENLAAPDEIARVLRGGAFSGDVDYCRCAFRFGRYPGLRGGLIGFRLALSPFQDSGL